MRVALLGLEPRMTESKSGVLPLHYKAVSFRGSAPGAGNYPSTYTFGNPEIPTKRNFSLEIVNRTEIRRKQPLVRACRVAISHPGEIVTNQAGTSGLIRCGVNFINGILR